jgi:hypothetical protein
MTYTPARSEISNITQANPAVVTTTSDHGLTTGQVVRVHVPQDYGMSEINQDLCSVTVLSNTTFSLQYTQVPFVNVDSRQFTAFTTPSNPSLTAEILPVGSGPTPLTNTEVQVTNGIADSPISDAWTNIATTNQPF